MSGHANSSGISILSASFGSWSEVDALNPSFRREEQKLMVSLDVERKLAASLARGGRDLLSRLLAVCPSLRRHKCRGASPEVAHLDPDILGEICGRKALHDPVDVAHLLEHMVLDLMVEISGTTRCSGVTCALKSPDNRFHVFVECKDQAVGLLAFKVAAAALTRFLERPSDPAPFQRQVRLARWMVTRDERLRTTGEAARVLGCSEKEAMEAVRGLIRMGFLRQENLHLNFSGVTYFTRGSPEGRPGPRFPFASETV